MTGNNMPSIEVELCSPEPITYLDLYQYRVDKNYEPVSTLYHYRLKFPNVHIAIQELENFQSLLTYGIIYSFDLYNNILNDMLTVALSRLRNERKFHEYQTPEEFPVKIYVR